MTSQDAMMTAYENAHMDALALMDRLRDQLFELPAPDNEENTNWGHVGSVAYVNNQLSELIEFLGG